MRKKLYISFLALASVVCSYADNKVVIRHTNGNAYVVPVTDVDSMYFTQSAVEGYKEIGKPDTVYTEKPVVCNNGWYANIENEVVSDYMNEVDYSSYNDDYTVSFVGKYINVQTSYRKDQPLGEYLSWDNASTNQNIVLSRTKDFSVVDDTIKVADNTGGYCVYNLLPGETYYYRVTANNNVLKESHFFTIGQVRMMHLNSINNVRDIGGWKTEDGHTLKYGKIYRGGEINTSINPAKLGYNHDISSEDSIYMHDKMKIRLDIDLRDAWDLYQTDSDPSNDKNHNVLGSDVEYCNEQVLYTNNYFILTGRSCNIRWGETLKNIIKAISEDRNVYIHCTWGADRTGMLSMLIEGLCGVSEADIQKDYELTSMYISKSRVQDYWGPNLKFLKSFSGTTFRDKVEAYFKKAGVTQEEIDTLRSVMLE